MLGRASRSNIEGGGTMGNLCGWDPGTPPQDSQTWYSTSSFQFHLAALRATWREQQGMGRCRTLSPMLIDAFGDLVSDISFMHVPC